MRLCTFEASNSRQPGILRGDKILPVSEVNAKRGARFPLELLELIQTENLDALAALSKGLEADVPLASPAPLLIDEVVGPHASISAAETRTSALPALQAWTSQQVILSPRSSTLRQRPLNNKGCARATRIASDPEIGV